MALPLRQVFRMTAVRLTALFLLLFAACAVILVFYVTSMTERALNAQTIETINAEAAGLGRSYQRGGVAALARMVAARSRQPGGNLYLLAESDGRILSGNIESLQPGVLDSQGWTRRPFSYRRYGDGEVGTADREETVTPIEGGDGHQALALVLRLPNEMTLLVGRDMGDPIRFRGVIRRALMVALGTMAAGGLLIWFFVGRRALRRIDEVSEASRRIMGGDLSGRLPVSGSGDEFDRLSTNLNAMLAKIAALNEGLREVSDNIAHDLKTPLTRLRNRAEAALSGKTRTADYREALEATIAESDQLIRTFNAILMISRLEAGYSAEQVAQVDLRDAVADVVELYEPVAEDAGVSLTLEQDAAVPQIQGNRELIAQSLSNIVDNAIKYSSGTGRAAHVVVRLTQSAGEVSIAVDDNGPGIPDAADRKHATERFVRLERSRSQPGSGLGLSLAGAVMKFHGGRLDLLPLNPGLSVVMTFPGPRS